MINELSIPTYIINLPKRQDRLVHVLSQFDGKKEFDINIIEATEHDVGAVGLWISICRIVKMASERDEDVIIICEDDHKFTTHYNKDSFVSSIYEAHRLGANILLGGILGGFNLMLPLKYDFSWMNSFWGTQFVVVYRSFFNAILSEPFNNDDAADTKFSSMTSNKFVMYPMISVQKDFGYSDIATKYRQEGLVHNALRKRVNTKMENIHKSYSGSLIGND